MTIWALRIIGNDVPTSRTVTVASTPITPGSASRPISSTPTAPLATSEAQSTVPDVRNDSQTSNASAVPTEVGAQQTASAHVTAPAPPANTGPHATNTSGFLTKVQEKCDAVYRWLLNDWEMKLLTLLALVWGIRAFNEQIRGNTLNEMEACRNHPVSISIRRLTKPHSHFMHRMTAHYKPHPSASKCAKTATSTPQQSAPSSLLPHLVTVFCLQQSALYLPCYSPANSSKNSFKPPPFPAHPPPPIPTLHPYSSHCTERSPYMPTATNSSRSVPSKHPLSSTFGAPQLRRSH